MRPFHLEAQRMDLNKFVWDLAEYEKRLLNVVL